ncbi:DNA cytosine methyltransferase [Paludisphaera mucosa]|uniref:Cytosine-specific methyltransferase n=1 Tax=Paludisphaera mucosa TaxID=3030827 RepID=A0ABT6F702_9BACT|nr:DNA cytosine methyltransferase [Paludisphaera mucosa]MDG3003266.1 DNA cytosine methyltransferase [Paludisphaera mucosa]
MTTFGSLFAGIGGLDLGLERAGLQCRWQVERDPYARRVLAKHWPDVRRHDDVRTFPPTDPEEWRVDLVCGGFPCQDLSYAGRGAGLAGERSGLWSEFARIVRVLRPRLVLVENVSALITRGLDSILGTLASFGYDAEWDCIPAAAVGARHLRERVFILATAVEVFDPRGVSSRSVQNGSRQEFQRRLRDVRGRDCISGGPWAVEPGIPRVAHGIPSRVDRLRGLGNAVVPQVAEFIGRRLIELHGALTD